jgi:hypothetical protein
LISDVSKFITKKTSDFNFFGNVTSATTDRLLIEDASDSFNKKYMQINHQHLSGAATRTHSELDTLYTNYYSHAGSTSNPHSVSLGQAYTAGRLITTASSNNPVYIGGSSTIGLEVDTPNWGIVVNNANTVGVQIECDPGSIGLEVLHNSPSVADPGIRCQMLSTTSSAPALYLQNSSTGAWNTMSRMVFSGSTMSGVSYTGLEIDMTGVTTWNASAGTAGINLKGKTNAHASNVSIGVSMDAGWDFSWAASSSAWMTDNVGIAFGNSLDSSIHWNTGLGALFLTTYSFASSDIYLGTGGNSSEIRARTTGTSADIRLETLGTDANIEFTAANGDVAILTCDQFSVASTDSLNFNISGATTIIGNTLSFTSSLTASITGTTGLSLGSNTGNVNVTCLLGDFIVNAGDVDIGSNGTTLLEGNTTTLKALASAGSTFLMQTAGPYFEMRTGAGVTIRIYIDSNIVSPTGVPEGSIWLDAWANNGAVWVLKAGNWNQLAWQVDTSITVGHRHV